MKSRLIMLLLAVLIVCGSAANISAPRRAYAAASDSLNFDTTDVLEDLRSSTANGKPFDIRDYPLNDNGEVQLINFVEYCYSYRAHTLQNYGLYVYIYNPAAINFNTSTYSNKIQLATVYSSDGTPTDYAKFRLEFCSVSTEADYSRLFYKFKILFTDAERTALLNRLNSNERRYDVSGIELFTVGKQNAEEYYASASGGRGVTYKFSGYAAGCGPDADADSTLGVDVNELETVTLDVKSTFFRTGLSNKGVDHQNQLDSVYFSVPDELLDKYGSLQRIKAEWYEYKTKEIVVTEHGGFYTSAKNYIGVTIPQYNYISEIGYCLSYAIGNGGLADCLWSWNAGANPGGIESESLYYLFPPKGLHNLFDYDPYGIANFTNGVSSNELYSYIKNYKATFKRGKLSIKDQTISADLFEPDIDPERKLNTSAGKIQYGYSYYDFDADTDLHQLLSYNDANPTFWDKWKDFGLWDAIWGDQILNDGYYDVRPIHAVSESDFVGAPVDVSKRLLVRTNDLSALETYYQDARSTANGKKAETMFLFRFATSDYFAGALNIYDTDSGILFPKVIEDKAYMAQQSVFLDFDIIQLTFNRDGVYHVIPVVSNPIDIVNDITPPIFSGAGCEDIGAGCIDGLGSLGKTVLLIILAVFILFNLPRIIDAVLAVLKLIAYPFVALGRAIFKKS